MERQKWKLWQKIILVGLLCFLGLIVLAIFSSGGLEIKDLNHPIYGDLEGINPGDVLHLVKHEITTVQKEDYSESDSSVEYTHTYFSGKGLDKKECKVRYRVGKIPNGTRLWISNDAPDSVESETMNQGSFDLIKLRIK